MSPLTQGFRRSLTLLTCLLVLIQGTHTDKETGGEATTGAGDVENACTAEHSSSLPGWRHKIGLGLILTGLILHCLLIAAIVKFFTCIFERNGYTPLHQYKELSKKYKALSTEDSQSKEQDEAEMGRAHSSTEEDKTFLMTFSNHILFLGVANFLPCVIFFAGAYSGRYVLAAMIAIALKAIVGVLAQGWLVSNLRKFIDDTNPGISLIAMRSVLWLLPIVIALLDFSDLDLDAATAGQSWGMPLHTKYVYCMTWSHVPIIGDEAKRVGLDGILTLIFIVATVIQFYAFISKMLVVKFEKIPSWHGRDGAIAQRAARLEVWFELQHACDAASLTLLAERLNMLAWYAKEQQIDARLAAGQPLTKIYCHVGRSTAFWTRNLAEAAPSLWFSVSLLALNYDSVGGARSKLMILSVLSSILTIIKASLSESVGCVEAIRVGGLWQLFGQRSLGAVSRLNILFLSTYLCLASIERLHGVLACDSHVFNLTSGCMPASLLHSHHGIN